MPKATYTVHFKMEQKVINLNSNISQLNLLYVKDIKNMISMLKLGQKRKRIAMYHTQSQ